MSHYDQAARSMFIVTIPGRPVPKERPRMGRGGRVYTPASTSEAEEAAAWAMREVCPVPLVAQKLGRRAIGVDLSPQYTALAVKRLEEVPLPMGNMNG